MKIGIDLRPLQNGHKFRGIGEVTKQTTNRILQLAAHEKNIAFIFYENDEDDPKKLLDIPQGLVYEVIKLGPKRWANSPVREIQEHVKTLYGNPIKNAGRCDVYLQFDYNAGVPTNTKTVLIKYDLIPYIFWSKYFESTKSPFRKKSVLRSLRTLFANYKFMRLLRRSLKNAHAIIAISENTKKDIETYFKVSPQKTTVVHLGVDDQPAKTNDCEIHSNTKLPTKPYLLFVGAADARRRIEDLIAAYNNLKAQQHDIQLVLVGENFKTPETIPNASVRKAVLSSSYGKEIITLGYIDDHLKHKLIKEALAFVYPTLYEGFGLPVLEAMLLRCPIITYNNSSLYEVGGKHALYAHDWASIKENVELLIKESKAQREERIHAAQVHAQQFTWDKTAAAIFNKLYQTGNLRD